MADANPTVYGAPWCPDCTRTKKFLGEHRVSYRWVDVDQDSDGLAHIEQIQNGGRTIPTVEFPDGTILIEPTNEELAQTLGISMEPECAFYDLAIIGGGPAGLAASIYAEREGLETVVIDESAPGGQAGLTERVDNYPGFPEGIGGAALADRFVAQAEANGVELLSAVGVAEVAVEGDDVGLSLNNGVMIRAHAVIIATGSTYGRLEVPGEERLIGVSIHFCATCDGPFYKDADELLVVGGGNSALEEALFLAQFARRIRIVARGQLSASRVIQDRIANDDRFIVHTNTDVERFEGSPKVNAVHGLDRDTGERLVWHPDGVFLFVGLDPNTGFLGGAVDLGPRGFITTSENYATSMPGVFAAGDVRGGSAKQVGVAVGEGISAMLAVRKYLEDHGHFRHPSGND
jgi:thioredoxin reductase (NADPH)